MAKQATAYDNVTRISPQQRRPTMAQDLERAICQTEDEPPFANNDRIAPNAAPPTDVFAFDTLLARLTQARAAMLAVQSSWDNEDANYTLPPKFVYQALWGVEELLGQGISAAETIAAAE